MASRDTARLRRNKISATAGSTRTNLWPIIRLQETESSVTNEPIVNCKTRCRSECVCCRPGRRVFLVVFSRVWPRAFFLSYGSMYIGLVFRSAKTNIFLYQRNRYESNLNLEDYSPRFVAYLYSTIATTFFPIPSQKCL